MGIQLLRGRDFGEGETVGDPSRGAPGVVILDRLAAERLFPNGPHGNALGQHVRLVADDAGQPPRDAEVVGIAANVQEHIVGQGERPHVYVPFGQETQSDMNLHLRVAAAGSAAEAQLAAEVRRTIRAVDSRLPVLTLRSIRHHLEASFDVWLLRTAARMFTVFGVVALLLAAVGLYGVRAYTVARRTREIGIRMAVGASAGDALGLILREGLWLTAIGAGVGVLLSLALGKALSGMLYQVSGADPVVLAAAPLLLAAVSLLASWVPARKAARIDPMVALRHE
jgi:putative ABC transport system permease protein